MQEPDLERVFEKARPRLLGLAYRLLGTLADAEDAVQDTFLKWMNQPLADIQNPDAWLTTACTRRCIDMLRAAYRVREQYVGDWLPEPVQIAELGDAEGALDLAGSLQTAFLLMLERLSPKERAAYLLREIFDVPYSEVAETLALREPACRKLVSRAKARLDEGQARVSDPPETQADLLAAFQAAIQTGEVTPLAGRLADQIRLTADSGGQVPSIRQSLEGVARVVAFLTKGLHKFWHGHEWLEADINGGKGFLIHQDDSIHAAVTFAFDSNGKIHGIFLVRNPQKLALLKTPNRGIL